MSAINLLPWREDARVRRGRTLIAGSVILWVVAAIIVFGAYEWMEYLKQTQDARNSFLRGEIAALEDEIKEIQDLRDRRERLVSRMNVIQELQKNRTELVQIMDNLPRILPNGVYLTNLGKQDAKVSLKGIAQSNARVSALMRAFEDSGWFHGPKLNVINVVNSENGRVSSFSLQIQRAGRAKVENDGSSG